MYVMYIYVHVLNVQAFLHVHYVHVLLTSIHAHCVEYNMQASTCMSCTSTCMSCIANLLSQ